MTYKQVANYIFWSFIIDTKKMEAIMSISLSAIKPNNALKYIAPKCKIGNAEQIGLDLKKVLQSEYAQCVKIGNLINSGTYADVFEVKGWENSYVARIEREDSHGFDVSELEPVINNPNNVVFSSPDKKISILNRINGIPLHGKFWKKDVSASVKIFKETMDMLMNLPDSVYLKYIDDITKIRAAGYGIDTFNPNNYLYDAEKGCINIIDVLPNYPKEKTLSIKDFYVLLDAKRYLSVVYNMTLEERKELVRNTQNFINRMIKLAESKGFNIKMEELEWPKRQDFIVNVYQEDPFIYKLGIH